VTQFDAAVPRSRSLPRDALVLGAGMALANAGNYAFNVVMAFLLGPEAYGALAALLALVLVGSVPGLALQAVVARRVALAGWGRAPGGAAWPGVGWLVGRAGLALVLVTVAIGPGLVLFLHLDSAVPVLWLALALAPTPLLFAVQGLLQGQERFGALAAVLLAGAGVKLAIGLALVAAGLGVGGAMAGVAAGGALAALAGLRLAGRRGTVAAPGAVGPGGVGAGSVGSGAVDSRGNQTPGSATLPSGAPLPEGSAAARPEGSAAARPERAAAARPGGAAGPGPGGAVGARPERAAAARPHSTWWREVGGATTGLLGLFLLANVDVLLARHYLDRAAAGRYALGAVVAKIAFWAPQFVVTVIFPRLVGAADPRRLLGGSALLIAGFGGLLAAGLAVADRVGLVVPVLGGGYEGLGPLLPLFAALGTGLALVQLLLFEGIATRDRRMGRAVVVALVAEVALVAGPLHGSVGQVAGAALVVVAALAVAGWLLLRQRLAHSPPGAVT
jgi:O-antigen/teichoic acid export membrane protein